MVANPRKTKGAGALRPLDRASNRKAVNPGPINYRAVGLPAPLEVTEDGWQQPVSITLPASATLKERLLWVSSIDDRWQVDDEWWRGRPISRRYYQVTTADGRRLTIFRDQANGGWYHQRG